MTSSMILVLMMQVATTQFLVSTKAGLVNYVQGASTVKVATTIPPGQIFATGPGGAVEILLNPGSYLRMGENTKVVFDRVDLYNIAVRILGGSMVIEANGFDKDLPLAVTSGALKMEVIQSGVYLFADGKVVVLDGKIRDTGKGKSYGKGYQISNDDGYRAEKVKRFATGLELWSQKRDAEISKANLNIAKSLRQVPNLPVYSLLDVWLWYPAFGSFIYMPGARYRSPYGYRYQTAGEIYSPGPSLGGGNRTGGFPNANANSGGGSAGGGGGSSVSNSTSAGGGGGSVSVGGASSGASAPASAAGAARSDRTGKSGL
jgi:FecR protein